MSSTKQGPGRPKKNDNVKLIHDVKVRLDKDTHNKLSKYSKKHNTTIAGAIRQAIEFFLESHK